MEPEHIFWLKRWDYAKRQARRFPRHYQYGQLAAVNQMSYLVEIFSWIFERKRSLKS